MGRNNKLSRVLAIGIVFVLVAVIFAAIPLNVSAEGPAKEPEKIEMMIINSPPTPPKDINKTIVEAASTSAVMLSDVPTSRWTQGCSATSAGMIFGYYDRIGYSNIYTGPANGGVCPLTELGQGIPGATGYPYSGACSIIATDMGFDGRTTRGHTEDYWISTNSPGPDPWVGSWTEHTWGECTADFMGTNQWKWDFDLDSSIDGNIDGATTYWSYKGNSKLYDYIPPASYGTPQTALCHGMRLFAESQGYTVVTNYNQKTDNQYSGGFSFTDYKDEINNGYPVMIQVTGHSMVGVGYDNTSPGTVYIHNTWDNNVHSMTWGGSYDSRDMIAVTVIHLAPNNTPPDADAGGPYGGYEGSAVTFDASGSSDADSDPLQYRWDFDNDNNWDTGWLSSATTTNTWYDDYSGTVVVEVYDGEDTDSDSTTVTIDNVVPQVNAGSDQQVAPYQLVHFSGSFSDPGSDDTFTFKWDFGDGTSVEGNLTPTHIYITSGTYIVNLTVTDDDSGTGKDSLVVNVGITYKDRVYNVNKKKYYHYIQMAVDDADSGNTLLASSSVYDENVVVYKTLTIIGEDPNDSIINGSCKGDVVKITANWVNFSGFKIINSGSGNKFGAGIHLSYVENTHIFDCICVNNDVGIIIVGSSNNYIENNICNNNLNGLIEKWCSSINTIANNSFNSNTYNGIKLWISSNNVISYNDCTDNGNGIFLYQSTNNLISYNNCSDNTYGIYLNHYSNNNKITSNTITSNSKYGLFGRKASNNNITSNTFSENKYAMRLVMSSNNNDISMNMFSENYGGLTLFSSSFNVVADNVFTKNDYALGLTFSANYNKITDNTITNNKKDAFVIRKYSSYNQITGNNISDNKLGMKLEYNSENNIIASNIISNNNDGLKLFYSSGNTIYHNNIIDNINQLYSSSSSNTWHNSNYEGNYWSDYSGSDTDSDGIGDTSLPHNGVDNYPLMLPWC